MYMARDFDTAVADLDLEALDRTESTAYALRVDDLTIGYCNRAWGAFATANDGGDLAHLCTDHYPILDAIHPILRDYYRALFQTALTSGHPVEHDHACHSPELERWYHMRITPLEGALLVMHHQVVEQPHVAEPHPMVADRYVDPDTGFAMQCCHCRTTRRVDAPDTWEWVPALLDRTRHDVSHGLCPVCFVHYFPDAARKRKAMSNPVAPSVPPDRR